MNLKKKLRSFTMKPIESKDAPAAVGPYSQSIKSGDMLFLSGQVPLCPTSGKIVGENVTEQTHQVMKNLAAVLKAAGGDFSHVLKMGIFLKDLEDFNAVNEVYASYLSKPFPARACVEVARLPKDVMVEIEAIARIEV